MGRPGQNRALTTRLVGFLQVLESERKDAMSPATLTLITVGGGLIALYMIFQALRAFPWIISATIFAANTYAVVKTYGSNFPTWDYLQWGIAAGLPLVFLVCGRGMRAYNAESDTPIKGVSVGSFNGTSYRSAHVSAELYVEIWLWFILLGAILAELWVIWKFFVSGNFSL
jgi:hypothetical protein